MSIFLQTPRTFPSNLEHLVFDRHVAVSRKHRRSFFFSLNLCGNTYISERTSLYIRATREKGAAQQRIHLQDDLLIRWGLLMRVLLTPAGESIFPVYSPASYRLIHHSRGSLSLFLSVYIGELFMCILRTSQCFLFSRGNIWVIDVASLFCNWFLGSRRVDFALAVNYCMQSLP